MRFDILTFESLLEKKFNIPSFQRGYRWEKENVEALLNDIQEFAHKKNKEPEEFYCLQPIVVTKNEELSNKEGQDVYDLLDGQQRLTTLWLILNSPRFSILWDSMNQGHKKTYTLQYESRQNLFSDVLNPNIDPLLNIDLFYLKNAFETINAWKGNVLDVLNTIVPNDPKIKSDNVRIIWYEFNKNKTKNDGSEHKQSKSIQVFSRLNYGKIALTDTELIKALILQSDIYPKDNSLYNRDVMKERLFRISTEWDDIEKGLYDDHLWGMLTPEDYNPENHMELLLHFVAEQIQVEHKYKIIDNQRRDFHIISNYLGCNESISPEQYAENIEKLWMTIVDAYNAIHNWYIDKDFYHLIGLNVLMSAGSSPIHLIKKIYEQYTEGQDNKTDFKEYLEGEIGKAIRITEKTEDSDKEAKRLLELSELKYGENNQRIIKILEATNIYLYLSNKSIDSRFNFKKFKDFNVTSLEHIHPQHLYFNDDIKYQDVKDWYDSTNRVVQNTLEYSQNEDVKASLAELNNLLQDPKAFSSVIAQCQECTEKIDSVFDKLAGMTSGHMHTLYNMALIDKDTNASLSNNPICAKRSILREREEGNKTYVPLATRYVFDKYLSKDVSDMKFWGMHDRESYFSLIEKAYNYFTSKIKDNGKSSK